jgi:hypothetical protein
MNRWLALLAGAMTFASTSVVAQVRYVKCDMQTIFKKPGIGGSEWTHHEGHYRKFFKIDGDAKMVSAFNARGKGYVPICTPGDKHCAERWSQAAITVDGRSGPAANATADIDFRRAFFLTQNGKHAVLIVADHGGNATVTANMTWTQEGGCQPAGSNEARPMPYPPGPRSTTFVDARVMPVSDAERDRAMSSRYGNTVTGLSGGSLWFHMWAFRDGLAYTGDDDDITAEGAVRQWYVGKEASGGYRLCEHPVAAEGEMGCYPLSQPKIGDRWIEHDVYGDAAFELLPGRQ